MPSYNPTITTRIRCGSRLSRTTAFNHRTSIDTIHQFIRSQFAQHLPYEYVVQVYDPNQQRLISLSQTMLDTDLNPFRWTQNESAGSNDDALDDTVTLYVVKTTDIAQSSTLLCPHSAHQPPVPSQQPSPIRMFRPMSQIFSSFTLTRFQS